jgi:hypothetical protein
MAELHAKILRALAQLGDVYDGLDDVPETGCITGVIVSAAFDGLDHRARQHKLWGVLDGSLTPEEARHVGPIATLTPAEAPVRAG